jgi:ribosomal-protein-alanine N-acetyltransferase
MKIEQVTEKDYETLYAFEMRNKAFFERNLPPRPEGYQQYQTFKEIMDDLLLEQSAGDYFMYLVKDDLGYIMTRINLQIDEDKGLKRADLGYRTDCKAQGKGVTSQAVQLVLEEAFTRHALSEVTAGTASDNLASQSVLIKNGFVKVSEVQAVMEVNGKVVDGFIYRLTRETYKDHLFK